MALQIILGYIFRLFVIPFSLHGIDNLYLKIKVVHWNTTESRSLVHVFILRIKWEHTKRTWEKYQRPRGSSVID